MKQGPAEGAGGWRRWLPHFSRAGKWTLAAVATAVIGVVVTTVLGGWLPGGGSDSDGPVATPTSTNTPLPFPPSRLVSQDKIGLYYVEIDGSPEGALQAFGQPTSRRYADGKSICTMFWEGDGLQVEFYDLGGGDACVDGAFCSAYISGRDWASTRGLQPGESARRIAELYPDAEQVEEPGAIIRWVLEPGVAPCGREAKGGLEAWTAGGRVSALVVTYLKGGD